MPVSKKKVKKTPKKIKKESFWEKYKTSIISSSVGGIIALLFSQSLELGIVVFIAVWIGNWVAKYYLDRK